MEEMLFLCHQIIHDFLPVKGDHIVVQLYSVREELSPVEICLPVIVNEHRRIDPAAGKLYRIFKRPCGLSDTATPSLSSCMQK